MSAENLHVCQIISSFRPVIGGVERVTENLCKQFLCDGIDVVVLTRRYPGLAPCEEINGVPVYRLGHPSHSKVGALSFAVHTLWALLTRFRAYRIIHVQNIDTPLLIGLVAQLFLRRRLVVSIHGEQKILRKQTSIVGRTRLYAMRRLSSAFTAFSTPMEMALLDEGVPAARIRTVPNGVDTDRFRPPDADEKRRARSQLGLDQDEVVVLYIGRLVPLKRVDILLRTWSRLSGETPRRLLIVGDGPEHDRLMHLASSHHTRTVRFEGAADDVLPYLNAADIFVLSSEEEGLSLALIEAMAAGLPAIVTQLPGSLTLVGHNEHGLTVPVNDEDALVAQLELMLESPALRERLGQNARERICREYSLATAVRSYQTLYQDVMLGDAV